MKKPLPSERPSEIDTPLPWRVNCLDNFGVISIPFFSQASWGLGIPSAWQRRLAVTPGSRAWLSGKTLMTGGTGETEPENIKWHKIKLKSINCSANRHRTSYDVTIKSNHVFYSHVYWHLTVRSIIQSIYETRATSWERLLPLRIRCSCCSASIRILKIL